VLSISDLIKEVLLKHAAVFWLDSSVRFSNANLPYMLALVVQNGGLMTFDNAGHSIFAATHEGMYRYLPITREAAANASMRGACAFYIYQTREVNAHNRPIIILNNNNRTVFWKILFLS